MITRCLILFAWLLLGASPVAAQRVIHVESNFSEAQVFADSVMIGTVSQSPFTVQPSTKVISVKHPDKDIWTNRHVDVELNDDPVQRIVANFVVNQVVDTTLKPKFGIDAVRTNKKWITIATGVSVLSGVAAIHFRTKADNRFNDYLKTGDNRLKQKVKTLDVQSGLALGVMQIGVGVIAFRLIF